MNRVFKASPRKNWRLYFAFGVESIGVIAVSIFMLGCSWFDNDSSEPSLDEPEPPVAVFSADVTTGQAPLTVSFSSSSINGTAPISNFEWDFGDGNTSTEENPQHIYESSGTFDVSLRVTSRDGADTELKVSFIEVESGEVSLKLSVIGEEGALLDSFEITSEDFELASSEVTDTGIEVKVSPEESDGVIKISKSGYLDQFLFLEGVQVDITKRVTLMKRAEPIEFNAFLGGEIRAQDGAGVSIPAESLVLPDGSTAVDTAQVYITPIDISDPVALTGFPGSFYGTTAVGEERESLFSYGVVDITFEQDGQKLQLRDGAVAQVTLPLYASKSYEDEDLQAGDRIPMWYLDEASGLWIYESEGVVVENPLSPNGLTLLATTTHFTSFNGDINPPGLNFGGPGGGGGSNNLEDYICRLTVNLLGAEEGKRYNYNLLYSRPGWPASARNRDFTYDGSAITQPILRGFIVDIFVTDGEVDGGTRVVCNSGQDIETTITLGDAPPEFVNFNFRSVPKFTRDSEGLAEIKTNTIYAGGYFLGADEVVITSDFLQSPLILGNGVLFEVEHRDTDPEIVEFLGTISNEFGSTEETATAQFEGEKAPVLGYGYAFYDATLGLTRIVGHNYDGIDYVRVYELGDDIEAQGFLVFESSTDVNFFDFALPGQVTGYLRLEFENRFGMTPEFYQVSTTACLPGSEDCFPTKQ